MRKWTCAVALAVLFLAVSAVSSRGQEKKEEKKPDPKQVKELMRRKLADAEKLLEALATNNLEQAVKQAEDLRQVRKEAAWKIVKTEQYETWSEEFDRQLVQLIKAARDKNLEAAKLSYLGMTLSCFNCHAYVRDLGALSAESHPRP
jgi:hypothetical protein